MVVSNNIIEMSERDIRQAIIYGLREGWPELKINKNPLSFDFNLTVNKEGNHLSLTITGHNDLT